MFSTIQLTITKIGFYISVLAFTITVPATAACFDVQLLPAELKSQMIENAVWKPDCPVDIDRLRLVQFMHYDFSGKQQEGQIVVLDAVAERVMAIFKDLYHYKFPIAQAKTIENYGGQDKCSMAANNTCAFNFRPIAGKTLLSIHSYGLAIDVNPVQNPCLEPKAITDPEEILITVQPAEGQNYLNRTNVRSGMVEQILDTSTDLRVIELFKQNGFYVWGGTWNDPVDWQHFQPSRAAAEWLAFMFPTDATTLFELYIKHPVLLNEPTVRDFNFQALYEKDPQRFMQKIHTKKIMEMMPQQAYNSLL